ncbi:MAG: TolC family protein, partial [Phycisphaerales bacterium]
LLARAEAVPDVTLTGGVKLLDGAEETAFAAGVSVPLPLVDRNQGNILAARLRSGQGEALRRAARMRVQTDLIAAHQTLDAACREVRTLENEIIPGAEAALDAAETAFRLGKLDALNLLDSERTLFKVRRQHTDALARYHHAVIAVERLIGAPLHDDDPITGDSQ